MSNLPTTTLDPSFLRRELHRKRKSFIVRGGSAGAAPGRTTRLLPGQKSAGSPSPDGGYGFPSSRSFQQTSFKFIVISISAFAER